MGQPVRVQVPPTTNKDDDKSSFFICERTLIRLGSADLRTDDTNESELVRERIEPASA